MKTLLMKLVPGLMCGVLAVFLIAVPATQARADHFEFSGFLEFSDFQGTTHILEYEGLSGPSHQDVVMPGYDWLGDDGNTGPLFHLSCSATLVGSQAVVNRTTQRDDGVFSFPPPEFGTCVGVNDPDFGNPAVCPEVTIIDFLIVRRNTNNNVETGCEAGDFDFPQIEVTKTGPDTAKIGDAFNYEISFENTGNVAVENCTGDDPLLGGDLGVFEPGVVRTFPYTPTAGDPNPLENTVTITCDVVGGGGSTVSDFDSHSVALIAPEITVTKDGDATTKVGDETTYTIGFENTGSGDLENCTGNDDVLGDLGTFVSGVNKTFTRTATAEDPSPLVNTATITCDVVGVDNQVGDSDDHSVDIIDPAITVTKDGDATAKVGDEITYTIGFENTGSGDLENCTGNDDVLGDLGAFVSGVNKTFTHTAAAEDPSPLVNTATITCDVVGFDNQVSESDDHSVVLIDAAITVTKDGDATAKVGDEITYTIGFESTGSGDLENCTGNDDVLGDLGAFVSGVNKTFTRTAAAEDSSPLVNTATITCDVVGFDNQVSESDDHSVVIIDPAITVTKDGDATAKVGDEITYTIGFENTGSGDLENCTGNDDVLGDLGAFVSGVNKTFTHTAAAEDPSPLVNTATITCDVVGFDNQVSDSDDHSVDLVDPDVSLTKECRPDPVLVGGEITWAITVENTGTGDLDCELSDADADINESFSLAPTESESFNNSRTVTLDDFPLISNTASVVCDVVGFDNQVDASDSADCEVQIPSEEICRTPGFWGTHGGTEHPRSTNLTQLVIDDGGPLEICGATIDNTDVGNVNSAIEAMCVRIEGEQQRQLARQLTAMALNCIVSGGDADCTGTSVEELFAECNAACAADEGGLESCIDRVDCFNNGGQFDETLGVCVIGSCSVTGDACGDVECPDVEVEPGVFEPQQCVPTEGNCQDRDLDENTEIFDGVNPFPGPAGSPRACSAANGNGIKVVPVP